MIDSPKQACFSKDSTLGEPAEEKGEVGCAQTGVANRNHNEAATANSTEKRAPRRYELPQDGVAGAQQATSAPKSGNRANLDAVHCNALCTFIVNSAPLYYLFCFFERSIESVVMGPKWALILPSPLAQPRHLASYINPCSLPGRWWLHPYVSSNELPYFSWH